MSREKIARDVAANRLGVDAEAKARALGWLVQRPDEGDLAFFGGRVDLIASVAVIGGGFEFTTADGEVVSAKRGRGFYVRIPRRVLAAAEKKAVSLVARRGG